MEASADACGTRQARMGQDIPGVHRHRCKYGFAEQESWQKDPFECLKESYEYIVMHGIGSKAIVFDACQP